MVLVSAIRLATMTTKASSTTSKSMNVTRRYFASTAFLALTTSFTPAQCFTAATTTFLPHRFTSSPDFLLLRGGSTDKSSPRENPLALLRRHHLSTSTTTTTSLSQSAVTEPSTEASAMKGSTMALEALRSEMKKEKLDVYLIPSGDPHLSEYTPEAYKRREFISGFSGSAGTAVVTLEGALLWTDSRYWNEANLQLDSKSWTLMKSGQTKVDSIPKYLAKLATAKYADSKKPLRVGLDPFVHAASYPKELTDAFTAAAKDEVGEEDVVIGEVDTSQTNLIDPIWGHARPPIPTSPFQVHPLEYAGISYQDKVAAIRKEMVTKKATLSVFCALDDVAYLLNVRAQGDIETCPVGIAYATVSHDGITLYCDAAKVNADEIKQHLKDVTIKPYDDIVGDVKMHCEENAKNRVWIDKKNANFAISSVVPDKQVIDKQNAVTPMKACKNAAELEGMRKAHIVDGAAMANFMAWLEHTIVTEGKKVSEVEVDLKLTGCRAEQPGFKEVSFPTIAGVGPNGAIIHYRAQEGTDLMRYLDDKTPILIDSGGQYTYGTTDVTRTWHLGKASDEFIDYYTRVLKGNIALDSMQFPENTPGFVLDVFARKSLWDGGKDYGHGTGHGVGAALNVHEGPMGISPRYANKEVLKKGMVLSNEPGYYEDGNFGIRIENLLEIKYVKAEHNEPAQEGGETEAKSPDKKFLKFLKLTMIPIQKNLINLDLMNSEELDWLDNYHKEVFEKVSPLLEKDSPAMQWLEKSCAKIERKP